MSLQTRLRVSRTWTANIAAALCFAALQPAQAGSLQGVVCGPADKPLAGAMVTIIEAGDRSLTNTDGQYYLPDVPAGRSTVVVTSDGYLPTVAAVDVRENGITAKAFALKVDKLAPVKETIETVDPRTVVTTEQWQPPLITQSGPVEDGWQMTAASNKQTYLPAEPILVTVSLKNVSGKDQRLVDAGFADDFEFAVTCQGIETPATQYGANSREGWIDLQRRNYSGRGARPSLVIGPFHPGQTKTYTLVVNRFRDMTLDGSYTVVVKHEPRSSTQLVSDPIQVEVRTPISNDAGAQ